LGYAIEIRDLWYKYPTAKGFVLKGINLSVEAGEFLGILGPTGAGKTTLCMCLNGLIPHYAQGEMRGEVRVMGEDTRAKTIAELSRHVGIVFQDPDSQLITSSVEDEIAFGLRSRGFGEEEIGEIVDECLLRLGISHLRGRVPQTCSGGEKQKIAIAAAIAGRPDIIVFDEATSDLDPISVRDIFGLAAGLHSAGRTIIFVTHEVELLAKYATRIAVLADGGIQLEGDPRSVFSRRELFDRLGLRLPQVAQLALKLEEEGIPLKGLPLTVQEAKDLLIELGFDGRWAPR
jgi:energy-coupling factor transporter ATP-binding protein EcfA2